MGSADGNHTLRPRRKREHGEGRKTERGEGGSLG